MSTEPAQESPFDYLLAAMPEIAAAVNAFSSEEVQRSAFEELVRTFRGDQVKQPTPTGTPTPTPAPTLSLAPEPADEVPEQEAADASPTTSSQTKKAAKKAPAKQSFQRVKDYNFWPEGHQSLREFVEAKKPVTNHERNAVIVYWFEEVVGFKEITVGHVVYAYEHIGVKPPAQPDNALSVTASRTSWLDTSDRKAIRTTHGGRNYVQFEMPAKAVKKENQSA